MAVTNISSGTTNGLNIGSGSVVNVYNSGVFNSGGVFNNGTLNVSNGGRITSSRIQSGTLNVVNGGYISNLRISGSGGVLSMYSGADNYVENVTAYGGTTISVSDGRLVSGFLINEVGLYLSDKGIASNTYVNTGGYMQLSGGGHVYNTTISGATLDVYENGIVDGVLIDRDLLGRVHGVVNVYNNGIVNNATLDRGADLNVIGGVINNAVVSGSDTINVVSGGSASNVNLLQGFLLASNGPNNYIENVTATSASISVTDGTVVSTTLNFSGTIFVASQGIVSSTIINNYGDIGIVASDYGKVYDTTINSGGIMQVFATASAFNTSINAGGTLSVNSGTAENISISGGTLSIFNNGVVNSTLVNANGTIIIVSGGSAFNTNIVAGTLNVSNGFTNYVENTTATYAAISVTDGRIIGTTLNQGGALYVRDQGIASNTVINNSEDIGIVVLNSGRVYSTVVNNGGKMEIASAGNAYETTINDGGYAYVLSNGNAYNTSVGSGGILEINSGGNLSGIATIDNGGSAVIWYEAGGSANLLGNNNTQLVIKGLENGGTLNTVIEVATIVDNFSGENPGNSDSIVLQGINQKDVVNIAYQDSGGVYNPNYVTLTLQNGSKITMNIIGAESAGYALSSQDGQLVYEVCFLTGSLIRTINGDTKVEDLRAGEKLVTYDWKNKREVIQNVKWIGYKNATVNPNLPDDMAGYPVRILKDAIAGNVPYKDLLVTPEHCLFFDNKFVPARMLVNNYNIFYDYTITDYIYYHVETDTHSVIYADGMLTESYLDTGNRYSFLSPENNVILFPQQYTAKNWREDGCAPLITDHNHIEPLFNRLLNRAQTLGLEKRIADLVLDNDPQLYIQIENGQIFYPHAKNKDRFVFTIPSDIETIHLVSQNSRPCDTIGSYMDDRRQLGVLIGNITLFNNNITQTIDTHLHQDHLEGWHGIESHLYRWTNGNARLSLQKITSDNQDNVNILVVHVVASGPYVSLTHEIKKIA